MKSLSAGLVGPLGAILLLAGCAQPIGGSPKPNAIRITLPQKADHAVELNLIVGEFKTLEVAGKKRTLTLTDRKVITFNSKVVIPAGAKSVDVPFTAAPGLVTGREFIVGVFEKTRDGTGAPMVGVTTLRVGSQGELVSAGGIHIGPRPRR